jgi:hypothetical protein
VNANHRPGQRGDGALLRLAAVAAPLGILVQFVATAFHGGHDPGDLPRVLPDYADNAGWLAVHLAQFAGVALATTAFVALSRLLAQDRRQSAALARLGLVAAVVALAVYAANQAVDGVAIKFVADTYVSAAPADRADALLVAEAVRHVELGLTSLFELNLGTALVLFGLAMTWSVTHPTWLGLVAVADGLGWVVVAVVLAARGFEVSTSGPALAVVYLLGLWLIAVAVLLWRNASPTRT